MPGFSAAARAGAASTARTDTHCFANFFSMILILDPAVNGLSKQLGFVYQ